MRISSRSLRDPVCAVMAIATAAGCGRETPTIAETMSVRPDGAGVLRIGMSVEEARRTLGEDLEVDYADLESCDHISPAALVGASAMVVRDTIVRVEIRDPGLTTPEGAGIGTTETELLGIYGDRAQVTPHKYSGPEWHYVTVRAEGDSAHAIVFETDGRQVKNYRAGRLPEVEWVEGCA